MTDEYQIDGTTHAEKDSNGDIVHKPDAVDTDEIVGMVDYVAETETELDGALSNAGIRDTIISSGFRDFSTRKDFNTNGLTWIHFGGLRNPDGSDIIGIGTDDSGPADINITVTNRIQSEGSVTGDACVRFVSGTGNRIMLGRVSGFNTGVLIPNASQGTANNSSNYVYSQRIDATNTSGSVGVKVESLPSGVSFDGFIINSPSAIHAKTPVVMNDGVNFEYRCSVHEKGSGTDIDDAGASGGNRFVGTFMTRAPDKQTLHPDTYVEYNNQPTVEPRGESYPIAKTNLTKEREEVEDSVDVVADGSAQSIVSLKEHQEVAVMGKGDNGETFLDKLYITNFAITSETKSEGNTPAARSYSTSGGDVQVAISDNSITYTISSFAHGSQ